MAIERYAVAEIAAQEICMKVYEVSPRIGIRVLDSLRRPVPVGQDTYIEGRVGADTLDRICDTLNLFHRVEKEYKVVKTLPIATSAIRDAANCAMILDQIQVRTGYHVQALSNSEQRFIRLKGVASEPDVYQAFEQGTLLVDVGEGSLQVSIFRNMMLITTQNIALGTYRISEMFSEQNGDIASVEGMIRELIENDVHTFEKMFLQGQEIKNIVIVGDAITTFIRQAVADQSGETTTAEAMRRLYEQVNGRTPAEISRVLEIPVEYANVFMPFMLVYQTLLEVSKADTVYIPKADFSDGKIRDYVERKGILRPNHDYNEDILTASRNISRRYMGNEEHSRTVEKMACQIFDAMKNVHGLGKRERLLLEISSILHDCGKYISMSAPGECAYRIIMATEILGLSHAEREMVANIVRYNTVEMPRYEDFYGSLSEEQFIIVCKLAAILRVANALDRSHKSKFSDAKLNLKDSTMTITTKTSENILLEKSTLENRSKFLEDIYGIRLVIRQVRRRS